MGAEGGGGGGACKTNRNEQGEGESKTRSFERRFGWCYYVHKGNAFFTPGIDQLDCTCNGLYIGETKNKIITRTIEH